MKKAGTPFSGIRRLTAGCENAPQAGFTAGLRSVCFFYVQPGARGWDAAPGYFPAGSGRSLFTASKPKRISSTVASERV